MKNVCPAAPRAWPDCPGQRKHTLTIHYLASSCVLAPVSSSPVTSLSWGEGQKSPSYCKREFGLKCRLHSHPHHPPPLFPGYFTGYLLIDFRVFLRVCDFKQSHHKHLCTWLCPWIYLSGTFPEVELLCQRISMCQNCVQNVMFMS